MADKFRTQDVPLTGNVSYVVSFPNAPWFVREFLDLFWDMTQDKNWVAEGDVTVSEATQAAIRSYMGFRSMLGEVIIYVTTEVPSNCLPCDGSTYLRVDYPELYAVIHENFIIDEDTFYLPDMADRFPIGASDNKPMSAIGGEDLHGLTVDELPEHTHEDTGHQHTTGNSLSGLAVMPGEGPVLIPNPIPALTGTASANISVTGGNNAFSILNPFVALKFAVVAR